MASFPTSLFLTSLSPLLQPRPLLASLPLKPLLHPIRPPCLPKCRTPFLVLSSSLPPPPPSLFPPAVVASLISAAPHVDSTVLRASANASFNLIALCTFVVWMQKSGHLPAETPSVLSQVSFRLLIPCFLMSKVSQTIASHPKGNIFAVPLVALFQVVVGAILGRIACILIYGSFKLPSLGKSVTAASVPVCQWHDAIVLKTGPPPHEESVATKKEALITVACAFGNSVTLPLVFLSGFLSGEDLNTAAGYLALFMMGWSPCLWTLGYQIIGFGSKEMPSTEAQENKYFSNISFAWLKRLMNPPLYGVLFGLLVGGTPLSHLFFPPKKNSLLFGAQTGGEILSFLISSTAGIFQPIVEAASLLGSAALAMQAIVLASSLANSIPSVSSRKGSNKLMKMNLAKGSPRMLDHGIENSGTGVSTNVATPTISLEDKAFWVICLIRLLIMPFICLRLIIWFHRRGWLPSNPLCTLTLLVEAAMPTAQNLVILTQLHASTQPLTGVLANLLVRQYILSLLPLTAWMTIFLVSIRAL